MTRAVLAIVAVAAAAPPGFEYLNNTDFPAHDVGKLSAATAVCFWS